MVNQDPSLALTKTLKDLGLNPAIATKPQITYDDYYVVTPVNDDKSGETIIHPLYTRYNYILVTELRKYSQITSEEQANAFMD